ncbi:MAG: PAS domain S-box protein, partial [Anaerolineales bacterium]
MDNSNTTKSRSQKSGFNLSPYSLPGQIIISTVLLVVLTAAAVGLPALWIIRQQLDHQAWSQIEQGYNAALSLYQARERDLNSAATLIAQRARLSELLVSGDVNEMVDYLRSLQTVEELDLLAICSADQQLTASTSDRPPEDLCASHSPGNFYLVSGQTLPQVWLIGNQPIEGSRAGERLLTGLKLDSDFAEQMRSQTGLEHTVFVGDRVIATSQGSYPASQTIVAPRTSFLNTSDLVVCCEYSVSDQTYYGARLQLDGDIQAEIALQVSDISATQRTLITVLAGSMLAVALLGSALGVISARRISRPLVSLSNAALRFSQGDLDTPVQADTQVREVVQVSQALERARLDLAGTLAELREEKAWVEHLLESIVEGIVTLDSQCRITFFSHGAERITGWSRREVLYRRCDEVFRLPDEETPFSQHIPPPGQKNQLVVQAVDGRQVILAITGARLTPTGTDDSQVALVFRDVSEEVAVHHLLGYFIANVTHEFRTPLSALGASIELLIDQKPDLSEAEVEELLKSLHLS